MMVNIIPFFNIHLLAYVRKMINQFVRDPPDNHYQLGYLASLATIYEHHLVVQDNDAYVITLRKKWPKLYKDRRLTIVSNMDGRILTDIRRIFDLYLELSPEDPYQRGFLSALAMIYQEHPNMLETDVYLGRIEDKWPNLVKDRNLFNSDGPKCA
jgi:hypothetical protein